MTSNDFQWPQASWVELLHLRLPDVCCMRMSLTMGMRKNERRKNEEKHTLCSINFHDVPICPCPVRFHPASPCEIRQECNYWQEVRDRPMFWGRPLPTGGGQTDQVIQSVACNILKSPCGFRLAMHQPLGSKDEPLYSLKKANTKVSKGSNKHWPTQMLVVLLAMVLLMALFLYVSILSFIEFTMDKSWSTSCANCTSVRQTDSLCFGSCSCREGWGCSAESLALRHREDTADGTFFDQCKNSREMFDGYKPCKANR